MLNLSRGDSYLKKFAKMIKKKHPELSLMRIQHIISKHLNFKHWGDLIDTDAEIIQQRIDAFPLRLEGLQQIEVLK